MFAGVINGQVVICCHPYVVVSARGVAGSFMQFEEAFRFLARRGLSVGKIYRHTGLDWDSVQVDPGQAPVCNDPASFA